MGGVLKQLPEFNITDEETQKILGALDSNSDHKIHYSDFLAAMLSTRLNMSDDLIMATFRRFDTDNSGQITLENLKQVIGDEVEGDSVDKLMAEADLLKNGMISYAEFTQYLHKG